MVKKAFALTSIVALTGLLSAGTTAGCSSESTKRKPSAENIAPPTTDAGTTEREPSSSSKKKDKEAAPEEEDEDCLTRTAIDATSYPYSGPTLAPGSCTEAEADKLAAFFDKAVETNEDPVASAWAAEVSDRCSKCAFTPTDATTWGPILLKGDTIANVNMGGCIEAVSGKKDCGRAFQQYSECQLNACLSNCTDQDAYNACIKDTGAIQDGPCHDATQAVIDDCGEEVNDYQKDCAGKKWAFQGPLNIMCVKGAVGQ